LRSSPKKMLCESTMSRIVCSCASVSEQDILRCIREGAHTLREVGRACEAGVGCQTCHNEVRRMISDHVRERLAAGETDGDQLPLFKKR
jgi:bacterioferritin-associated ferredoxin